MQSRFARRAATLLALLVVLSTDRFAAAQVLTFEDVDSPNNAFGSIVTNGYGGLNWLNVRYANAAEPLVAPPGSGYVNGVISPDYVAHTVNNVMATITTVDPDDTFDFNSVYLTGAWKDGMDVLFEAYLDSTSAYSQSVVVNSTAPQLFVFDFLGIDELHITSSGGITNPDLISFPGGNHVVMDNFTINLPEPSSLVLLGGGATMLAGVALRRRARTA